MAAIGAESLLVHGGLISGYRVMFSLSYLLKFPFPELWRLVTPFLLTGGGFNALWDMYMFWTYATQLELNSPRFSQPGDFATYVGFVAISILVSRLSGRLFLFTHLVFLPGQNPVSDTVPGGEEENPYVAYCPIIRKIQKGCMWRRHGGGCFQKSCVHN